VLLVSCVPFLTAKKDAPSEATGNRPPARQKSTTAEQADRLPPADPADKRSALSAPSGETKPATDTTVPKADADRTRQRSDDGRTSSSEKLASAKTAAEEDQVRRAGQFPPARKLGSAQLEEGLLGKDKDRGGTTAGEVAERAKSRDVRIEKHDHAKYVARIKSKAIDLVNKNPSSFLARLCRDTITDQWLLNIYEKDQKTYSFTAYSWDPVTGTWGQSFPSGKQPLAKWKHHIRASESGRECKVLKGSLR